MPDFFKQVGAARFGVMAGVAAVLTAFFLYIAGALTEPPKTILFSGLESRDAAAITAKLDSMATPYDVKDGHVTVTDEPGWGITVDPEWLARSSYQKSERT